MPTTMQVSSGFGFATFSALYVVTPAQVSGEASIGSTPSGTGMTWLAHATAYSA